MHCFIRHFFWPDSLDLGCPKLRNIVPQLYLSEGLITVNSACHLRFYPFSKTREKSNGEKRKKKAPICPSTQSLRGLFLFTRQSSAR